MKITIEPENEKTFETTVYDNVQQFAMCGITLISSFRRVIINDINALLGLLKATELDIEDHKRSGSDSTN